MHKESLGRESSVAEPPVKSCASCASCGRYGLAVSVLPGSWMVVPEE